MSGKYGIFETPKTRWLLRQSLPLLTWRIKTNENRVYLTFDDGPTQGITEKVVERLAEFNARATFFCIGEKVVDHHYLQTLLNSGHGIGNHSYSHMSGWSISMHDYLEDVRRCDEVLPSRDLKRWPFRPPYGLLQPNQGFRLLIQRKIVMWDVNSFDYRPDQTPKMISDRVVKHSRPGSIVLFHDSNVSGNRLLESLPRILEKLSEQGFSFSAIPSCVLDNQNVESLV